MSTTPTTDALAQAFVMFSVEAGVLRFGDFTTKAGRKSPYFFNTGLFDDGAKLMRLGEFYARRLIASGLEFDMLFGPAYKGITLAAAVAIGLAKEGRSVPFAYNRKEAKDHGEGGTLVGAPVRGRVLIIDDVITDGASKREAADMIRAAGATPVGVAITMDRQERASDDPANRRSGVQYVEQELGLRVVSIATLADLMALLQTTGDAALAANLERVAAYRARYGIDA
ncbi:orotate phosphoribosyltransferase [Ideonella sp. 4Y11]|uniref:Orotate phosphoribosyltransferase n=1 Tax=Ideonella aquatica TaxID=2824119 RepID=A0A941BRE0_9BURK|nr:orotate phosphoribosyltransferase [Ideonella aquatica]MBQ0960270.1 orotate phosphoribosyltransferase [Ideonella aquatica]